MLTLLDFQQRSLNGPVMKMEDFDLSIAKKARQIVKKYSSIKFNSEELIVDDETADAVFQAALEFSVETGVLNIETQRIVNWSREELGEVARWYRENPTSKSFGKGTDEHTISPRTGKDTRPPVTWTVNGGVVQEEWFIPYIQSSAQEEVVQGFGIAGGLATACGNTPKVGTPSEILAGLHEARLQAEALRRAGRPHMHLGIIPTVSTTGATAAVLAQGLRGPHNSMIGIHIVPEQKIDWERLNLSTLCQELGISPWVSAMSVLGGLTGGPVGVAIAVTANFIEQLSMSQGKMGSIYVNDMRGRNSHRAALWAYSASMRAIERNVGVATGTCAGDSSACFSVEETLLRGAVVAITLTASGCAYNWGAGTNGITARIQHDVMKNIAGMSREKVNGILNALSVKLEEMDSAGGGNPVSFGTLAFPLLYDVETIKPKPEYVTQCKNVVEILAAHGVPISDTLSLDY